MYVSVNGQVYKYRCAQKPGVLEFPGVGVKSSCEPLDMGTGN